MLVLANAYKTDDAAIGFGDVVSKASRDKAADELRAVLFQKLLQSLGIRFVDDELCREPGKKIGNQVDILWCNWANAHIHDIAFQLVVRRHLPQLPPWLLRCRWLEEEGERFRSDEFAALRIEATESVTLEEP